MKTLTELIARSLALTGVQPAAAAQPRQAHAATPPGNLSGKPARRPATLHHKTRRGSAVIHLSGGSRLLPDLAGIPENAVLFRIQAPGLRAAPSAAASRVKTYSG